MLDERGRTTRTLRAGAGLVAATVYEDGQPVWIVTGTDDAGVRDAASALDEGTLKNRFALAVADGRGVARARGGAGPVTYRRLASPLHAARASAAAAWCVALAAAALSTDHPLLLAVLGAIVLAGRRAGARVAASSCGRWRSRCRSRCCSR